MLKKFVMGSVVVVALPGIVIGFALTLVFGAVMVGINAASALGDWLE